MNGGLIEMTAHMVARPAHRRTIHWPGGYALDALHSAIMCRYESDDYAIMQALDKLIEYLKQAVEQKGEVV